MAASETGCAGDAAGVDLSFCRGIDNHPNNLPHLQMQAENRLMRLWLAALRQLLVQRLPRPDLTVRVGASLDGRPHGRSRQFFLSHDNLSSILPHSSSGRGPSSGR